MDRMKTFAIYLLIFVGFYIISNLLISAYLKTSYYKISSYEIEDKEITVTIITAKASKDDGYIEGKISNGTNEKIIQKYMKVELFAKNNVCLGTEHVKIDELNSGDLKNFKVNFSYDNVNHFKITFIDEKEKESEETQKPSIFIFKPNERVDAIINGLVSKQ